MGKAIIGNGQRGSLNNRSCVVRVSDEDKTCGFLNTKIEVGAGMTKAIVPGVDGLALLLESTGGGGAVEGYDSSLPDPLIIENPITYTTGPDGQWDVWYDGLSIPRRQGMSSLYFNTGTEGHIVNYMSSMSKTIDTNKDVSKLAYLHFATMLQPSGQTPLRGTAYINIGYMNTAGIFTIALINEGIEIHESVGNVVESHVIAFNLPGNIADHTQMMINIFPYDSLFAAPVPSGFARGTSWDCTPPTLYIPVLNYPVTDAQIPTP